jgi:anti-sigma factor RsiW
MNTAIHPVAPEEVMAFLDGELSTAQAQHVSDHLKNCADCFNLAAQLGDTKLRLGSWNVELLPAHIEVTIRHCAEQRASHSKNFLPRWHWGIRAGFGWKPILGFSLVAVAALLLTSHSGRSPQPTFYAASRANDAAEKTVSDTAALAFRPSVPAGIAANLERRQVAIGGGGDALSEDNSPTPADAPTHQPMIARSVSLTIVTKEFASSRASLEAILARHHGYSAQLTASTSENAQRSITASLRVPANELAATLAELKTLGHVETESQSGEEVTQQHADLVARLKNSRETEQRLQANLLQRTGKISDVLAVEQEIARVRGEIEQMEAEQKSLEHRVDFATIELRVSEEYKAKLDNSSPSPSTRIHNSLVAGYKNAAETLLGFVLFFAESGPTLLIWLVIVLVPALLLVRRYRRAAAAF